MIKEATAVGDTVEEATENAKLELGLTEFDDCEVEVLEFGKKKALGLFGGTKPKVRVYIEVPDKQENKKETNKKSEKKVKEQKSKTETKKETKPETAAETTEEAKEEENLYSDAVDASTVDENTPAGKAVKYLSGVLNAIGVEDVEMRVAFKENGAMILLSGEGLGVIIGRRGETLDALQYLVSLSSNIGSGYYRISLNIGNYREKREKTLIDLAKKISHQVISTGRSRSLEPMNPYERRIIHTAIQNIDGVTSSSVGEGINRHVVISSENGERSSRGRYSRPQQRREKIVGGTNHSSDSENLPLYGKIK